MRDLSVAPSALEAAVTAVKGRKRVTDQVRCEERCRSYSYCCFAYARPQDAEGKYEVLAKYARALPEEARAGKLVRASDSCSDSRARLTPFICARTP